MQETHLDRVGFAWHNSIPERLLVSKFFYVCRTFGQNNEYKVLLLSLAMWLQIKTQQAVNGSCNYLYKRKGIFVSQRHAKNHGTCHSFALVTLTFIKEGILEINVGNWEN